MSKAHRFIALPLETRRRQLKRLIYETVPEGEVKETADAAGIPPYTLYKMRDGEQEKYNLLRAELITVMLHRRDLRILDFIEDLFDRIAFPRPNSLTSLPELNRQVTAVLKECTEAAQAVISSVDTDSPGTHTITREEMAGIEKEINEAQAALEAMRHAAQEVYETGVKGKTEECKSA